MAKRTAGLALAAIGAAGIVGWVVGCAGQAPIAGSGRTITKSYGHRGFTRIEVADSFEVDIEQKDSFSVAVSADDNLIEYVDVSMSGDTLRIGLKPGNYLRTNLSAAVALPRLEGLKLSGSSDGDIKGFESESPLDIASSGSSSTRIDGTFGEIELRLSGSSTLEGKAKMKDGAFYLEGSSKVELDGEGGDMSIDCEGSSDANLADFPIGSATVKLDGSSTADIDLGGRLDANLDGSSVLTYSGNPTLGTISTGGGSELKQK